MAENDPFDPLSVDNVGVTLAIELLERPLHALPPSRSFPGAGIYALYYTGKHAAYKGLRRSSRSKYPVYIGSAVRENAKQGFSPRPTNQARLYNRLRDHAASINATRDLSSAEFRCRYLILNDAYITLAESVLISTFRPPWNGMGFGSKVVGGRRMRSRPSLWDSLHPGRRGRPRGTKTRAALALANVEVAIKALREKPSDEKIKRMIERIMRFV